MKKDAYKLPNMKGGFMLNRDMVNKKSITDIIENYKLIVMNNSLKYASKVFFLITVVLFIFGCSLKTPHSQLGNYGDTTDAKRFLDNGGDINKVNKEGNTFLMLASLKGKYNFAKMLIDKGADINHKNNNGDDALKYAAGFGEKNIVELLLNHGADIHSSYSYTKNIFTSALLSYSRNKSEVQGAVKLLIDNGADLHFYHQDGMDSLYYSALNGYSEVVNSLLNKNVDINTTYKGKTPIMIAAEKGYGKIVMALLKKGADTSVTNYQGKSILDIASENGDAKLVKAIIQSGIEVNNKEGAKALMYAVRETTSVGMEVKGLLPTGRFLGISKDKKAAYVETIKVLLQSGANPNLMRIKGYQRPSSKSIKGGMVAHSIGNKGEIVDAINGGITALDLASNVGHNDIVDLLRKYGAKK